MINGCRLSDIRARLNSNHCCFLALGESKKITRFQGNFVMHDIFAPPGWYDMPGATP